MAVETAGPSISMPSAPTIGGSTFEGSAIGGDPAVSGSPDSLTSAFGPEHQISSDFISLDQTVGNPQSIFDSGQFTDFKINSQGDIFGLPEISPVNLPANEGPVSPEDFQNLVVETSFPPSFEIPASDESKVVSLEVLEQEADQKAAAQIKDFITEFPLNEQEFWKEKVAKIVQEKGVGLEPEAKKAVVETLTKEEIPAAGVIFEPMVEPYAQVESEAMVEERVESQGEMDGGKMIQVAVGENEEPKQEPESLWEEVQVEKRKGVDKGVAQRRLETAQQIIAAAAKKFKERGQDLRWEVANRVWVLDLPADEIEALRMISGNLEKPPVATLLWVKLLSLPHEPLAILKGITQVLKEKLPLKPEREIKPQGVKKESSLPQPVKDLIVRGKALRKQVEHIVWKQILGYRVVSKRQNKHPQEFNLVG